MNVSNIASVNPYRVLLRFLILIFLICYVSADLRVKRAGVLIAPGFEMLDALGPYETLKEVQQKYYSNIDIDRRTFDTPTGIECADDHGGLEITVEFVAGHTDKEVKSYSGVAIIPEFDMSLDPYGTHFDLLIIGAGVQTDEVMDYVKRHHASGGLILTVCTGATVPAKLGLLDGYEATTNSLFLKDLQAQFPMVRWVDLADNLDRRFVKSTSSVTTTAGITAGIDGTLSIVREWCGWDVAEATRMCLEWPLQLEACNA